MPLSDWANVATIVLGIVGALGLIFGYLQITALREQSKRARLHQIEAVARTHYQDFVRLCVEYPQYSVAREIEPNLDLVKETFGGDHKTFYQYEWFFVAGLNAMETIYSTIGVGGSWKYTIISILTEHRKYIVSKRYDEIIRGTMISGFQDFIDEKVIGIDPERIAGQVE